MLGPIFIIFIVLDSKICTIIFLFMILKHLKCFYISNHQFKGRTLLLIAHPDDESMFFAPFVLSARPIVLCLSIGDYYNKGSIRETEMRALCKNYNIPLILSNYFIDNETWDIKSIINVLKNWHTAIKFDRIVTFDSKGVSGHKNHISCYYAAKKFGSEFKLPIFCLKSKNIICKYTCDLGYKTDASFIIPISQVHVPICMMSYHVSQMVWFRYFYILFSNYMIYNDFKRE